MKRKIGIDCPKCAVELNNKYYIGVPGKVSEFEVGSVYDEQYRSISECKECNGLGLVYSYEKIPLWKSILIWIMK